MYGWGVFLIEISIELIIVVTAWFMATLTTWGLITYTLKYVKKNGVYIDDKLKQFALQTTHIQKKIDGMVMPDLEAIQIDTAAMAEALKPHLQDILKGSFQGIKGADEAGMRRAAKFIREGMPDESQVPLLEAIENGDPEALQIVQAGKMFAKMLPALSEKSPLMADYGETFIQAIPTLFALRKQRQTGAIQITRGSQQGGFKPGVQER